MSTLATIGIVSENSDCRFGDHLSPFSEIQSDRRLNALKQNKHLKIRVLDTVKEFSVFVVPGAAFQLENRQASWHNHYADQHGMLARLIHRPIRVHYRYT